MADSPSSAHDLHVARYRATDIAGAVFVRDDALADIGDDFHIRMTVPAEASAGRDLVVIPDHESAERGIRRIAVRRNNEVVARLQPTMIALIERVFRSNLQH